MIDAFESVGEALRSMRHTDGQFCCLAGRRAVIKLRVFRDEYGNPAFEVLNSTKCWEEIRAAGCIETQDGIERRVR